MRDNHSDIEDHENLSSESEVRSVGSSPSSLNCLNSLNFKSMASMGQERSSPPSMLSVQGSSPGDILMNGGSPNSSMTSVQAALAALKAGQMSLNQVSLLLLPTPDHCQFVSLHFFCVISPILLRPYTESLVVQDNSFNGSWNMNLTLTITWLIYASRGP